MCFMNHVTEETCVSQNILKRPFHGDNVLKRALMKYPALNVYAQY